MSNAQATAPHVFSHLGQAPYKIVSGPDFSANTITGQRAWEQNGVRFETKPGTSCDHCGTYIVHAVWFKSSDGKRFKVGQNCAEKAFASPKAKRLIKAHVKKAHDDRAAAKVAQALVALIDYRVGSALDAQPHPNKYRASKGATRADYLLWALENAGATGKAKAAKEVLAVYRDLARYSRRQKTPPTQNRS